MTAKKRGLDIETELVHAGERQGTPLGQPVATPVYATTTFTYDSMAEMDKVFAGESPGYVYTRHGNPTLAGLEEAMRVIEGGAVACMYASGMAAVHAALLTCEPKPGDTVLASQDLYGATTSLLLNIFTSFGIKTVTADFSDLDALRAKASELRPRILIAETISNPLLKVCDISTVAAIAHDAGARLIVDNTFATPYLCRPLDHGADLVVHSATKYLGGHGDATGGVVVSRDLMDKAALIGVMKLVGGVLGVWQGHEIMRGVKTLALRVERQCANARALAEWLAKQKRVSRVYFPGLESSAAEIVKLLLRPPYAGALVSIELNDNTRAGAFRFMDALQLCVRSTSLGDVFTSVLHPASASHRDLTPARRKDLGISEGLIRISVGIENVADIIADIEQALEK